MMEGSVIFPLRRIAMSDYERIKGKLFRVTDVDIGGKNIEEWCEFYVKYVLECDDIYKIQLQLMNVSSYFNYLEKYCQNRVLIVSTEEIYIVHVDEIEEINPTMAQIKMKDRNELHFEVVTDYLRGSWTEQLKEAL